MKPINEPKTVAALAAIVSGRVVGDGQLLINRVASLESAGEGDIAFAESQKLLRAKPITRASCLIVPIGMECQSQCCIEVANPKLAFARIAEALRPRSLHVGAVHPTAIVAASAQVDESALIGAYVHIGERARVGARVQLPFGSFVGNDVQLGADSIIHPGVVLYEHVSIGERVILHAGVVVGADGFGYVRDGTAGYRKFPQAGTVVIEDDVEIGASTCVDRGALGCTRIGRGTKIDNLVQVGHNVQIGERVVIAAQTGISGSTVIEDDAVIGGQVGMGDHARVEAGAVIGSKAGILPGKIVRAGAVMWGVPVRPLDEYKRLNAHFGRLPQMREEINELRQQVKELAARLDAQLKDGS